MIARFLKAWFILTLLFCYPPVVVCITARTGCQDSFPRYLLESSAAALVCLSPMRLLMPVPETWVGLVFISVSACLPALAWAAIARKGDRRSFIIVVPALAAGAMMVYCGYTYPDWQRRRFQTHKLLHRGACRPSLRQLYHLLSEQLGVAEGAMASPQIQKALHEERGASFLAAIRKVLVAHPELAFCPFADFRTGQARHRDLVSSSTLDRFRVRFGYNLNTTIPRPESPLIWDRGGNHRYSRFVNVLYADGTVSAVEQTMRGEIPPDW